MMESVWHLQRLCSKEAPQQVQGPHASGRLQRTFVQQLRAEWFPRAVGDASASTRVNGERVLEDALEGARDSLYRTTQEVGWGWGWRLLGGCLRGAGGAASVSLLLRGWGWGCCWGCCFGRRWLDWTEQPLAPTAAPASPRP